MKTGNENQALTIRVRFDKDDAKIVIPVLLLALGLAFTPLNKSVLWSRAVVYYALYFFLQPVFAALNKWWEKFRFRCPYCKSRDMVYRGMNNYHGDVPYDWYLCNHCAEDSILLNNGRLVKLGPGRGAKAALESHK